VLVKEISFLEGQSPGPGGRTPLGVHRSGVALDDRPPPPLVGGSVNFCIECRTPLGVHRSGVTLDLTTFDPPPYEGSLGPPPMVGGMGLRGAGWVFGDTLDL